jgi:hypothetical protein
LRRREETEQRSDDVQFINLFYILNLNKYYIYKISFCFTILRFSFYSSTVHVHLPVCMCFNLSVLGCLCVFISFLIFKICFVINRLCMIVVPRCLRIVSFSCLA